MQCGGFPYGKTAVQNTLQKMSENGFGCSVDMIGMLVSKDNVVQRIYDRAIIENAVGMTLEWCPCWTPCA